jgi:hypothetical protein
MYIRPHKFDPEFDFIPEFDPDALEIWDEDGEECLTPEERNPSLCQ